MVLNDADLERYVAIGHALGDAGEGTRPVVDGAIAALVCPDLGLLIEHELIHRQTEHWRAVTARRIDDVGDNRRRSGTAASANTEHHFSERIPVEGVTALRNAHVVLGHHRFLRQPWPD